MMMKKTVRWLLVWLLASFVGAGAAWALPTEADVQALVKAGQYEQAEKSMAEVVEAKPDSAKAHYIYAQILAHERKFDEAARQAQRARTLDPAIKFTQPEKFRAFETLLAREQHGSAAATPGAVVTPLPANTVPMAAPPAAPAAGGGVPGWVWGAGLAVLALLLWRAVSRGFRSPVVQAPGAMPAQAPVGGFGGMGGFGGPGAAGYGQPVPQPGSGLRTGLAAGAGLAGGLAAGVLLDEMLHRDRDVPHSAAGAGAAPSATGLAGVEPGFFDREAQQDAADQLASRDVDFGSGNDWDDGGASSSGGGSDDW